MTRVENWETKLAEAIEGAKDRGFQYGAFDCCLFAASIIEAITGTNLMKGMEYGSEDDALQVIQSLGSDLLFAVTAIAQQHELESIAPAFAQRGDLVIVNVNDKQVVGIIGTDARYAVCTTLRGVVQIERERIIAAWRV
jgi:hypothetical protein